MTRHPGVYRKGIRGAARPLAAVLFLALLGLALPGIAQDPSPVEPVVPVPPNVTYTGPAEPDGTVRIAPADRQTPAVFGIEGSDMPGELAQAPEFTPVPAPAAPPPEMLPGQPAVIDDQPGLQDMPAPPTAPRTAPAPVAPPRPAGAAGESLPAVPPGMTLENIYRPHEGAAQDQPIMFSFNDRPLIEVIVSIGAMTGKNFLLDPGVGQVNVTLIAHSPISPDKALSLLQSVLVTHGFSMRATLDGELYKIRLLTEETDKSPIVDAAAALEGEYEEISTLIYPMEHASAENLVQLLPRFGTRDVQIDAYGPTNTLLITDSAHGIRNMLTFIQAVDIPGTDAVLEIFRLEHARAEVLAEQLQLVMAEAEPIGGMGEMPGLPRPPVPVRPQVRPVAPGQRQPTVVSTGQMVLSVVPDERLNMLIVKASTPIMEQIRDLIDKLDVPTPHDANNMHVYNLMNADAELLTEKLNAIIGTAAPRQGGPGGQGGGPGAIAGPSAEVQPFEKKVVIESYEATNSLLVVASPQDYAVIRELIAQLDIPQRQVHVESIILEVRINDGFRLAVEANELSNNDWFALNNIAALANAISGGPLGLIQSAGAGLTTGVLDGTIDIPTYAADGSLTIQTVPKVPVLLTALDSLTDLDVLSQPMLTTEDNEEAQIIIGEEVPVTTGSSTSLDQTAVDRSIYNRIERRDVGIKMKVKPQISEGDYVRLELDVEVSKVSASPPGVDPNVVGPTFQKSNVTNRVVIRDGSTGIVGGLISETTDRKKFQTPVAGDLPLLGWLFRRKESARDKRNLVVLVTPYVIKEGIDSERLTRHRVAEFRQANLDVLFEKGFLRRIKQRSYMRNEHSPSKHKLDGMYRGDSSFSRGAENAAPEGWQ